MPLTTTWTRSVVSKCGWAFSSVTRPCVAQRVWPMPVVAGDAATATPPRPASSSTLATGARRRAEVPGGADRAQLPVGLHGDSCGVLSAVLELLQPREKNVLHRPIAD